jgi:hypothetical protein
MSGQEVEIVRVKSEPSDVTYEESNKENVADPLSCPPSLNDGILVDGRSVFKQLKRKAKRSAMAGSFVCLICNKEYVYETFLTRHMVSKHRACEPLHQYKCRHCGAIFADEAGFEKHKSLFFDFLKHHLERVKPKELEQENEVSEFEEFVKATAAGEDERKWENNEGRELDSDNSGETEEGLVNLSLKESDEPAEKQPRVEFEF